MKIKLTPADCKQVTSKTTGKPFYVGNAELPDDGGQWRTCRWTVMSDTPFTGGAPLECVVVDYLSRDGVGHARPL